MNKNNISDKLLAIIGIISVFFFIGWGDNLEDIKKRSKEIVSVQADFTQEKHLKILSAPLISRGSFYYKKPDSFRWEYKSPIQSILFMKNDKVKRYIRGSDGMKEDAGVNLQNMQFVMQEITVWLKGDFENHPFFTAKMEQGKKIILMPKEESFAAMIKRIELTLSDQVGIIQNIVIYENEENFTKFDFTNVRVNQEIDDALFQKIQ